VREDRRSARARSEAGFSFIEILIVMGIIAVLAGLVVVAIGVWTRRGPEFETSQRVQRLQNLAETWKARFQGWYPPVDLTKMVSVAGGGPEVKRVPNRTNEGIEAFYQAMYWPGFATEAGITEDQTANLDEDRLERDAARGKELLEPIDAYGYPLVYFPHTEYGAAEQNPPAYIGPNGAFYPKPWKEESGAFENASSCQVFSVGEDGEPNTDDDVKGWRK
jgi:prepilin-type N-terminal cleavage/methylation domain-containing protein